MMPGLTHVLMIRMDRMGDLILTLPADQGLRERGINVDWWIPPNLSFIANNARPQRVCTELQKNLSLVTFIKLLRVLREKSYDAAVVFHAPWWVGLLLWYARVPVRVGVRSQWHSYLFFNRAVRQKRSRVEKSELQYNIDLAENGLKLLPLIPISPLLRTGHQPLVLKAPVAVPSVLSFQPRTYFVVHAGMGGSALNWPPAFYIKCIENLLRASHNVVLTGTAADAPYITPIKQAFKDDRRVQALDGKLNGAELLSVLSYARAVLAPSTGVLHIAASLGAPTLGLFSPVHVQSIKRWGPQGPRAQAFAPDVECPGRLACLGQACPHFNCMERVTPDQISARLLSVT